MMNNTTVDINFHELCGKLRSMKLSSMADTLEKQLANPNSGLQSFDERISEIICSEWDTRYTKKFNRFLKKATLKYPAADIDESIYDADRFLDTTTIERLAACNWIDEGKNLLITGSRYRFWENLHIQCSMHQRIAVIPYRKIRQGQHPDL